MLRATLYVIEQGARLEKEYQRLLVTRHDQVLQAVPLARLTDVVLIGRVGATTPALLALLDAGIPLAFVTRTGKLRGRLVPPQARNLPLRHLQYDRARDEDCCLAVARAIVGGKLRNMLTLTHRMGRLRASRESVRVDRFKRAIAGAEQATSLAALRGWEGMGSRTYFAVLRGGLPPAWATPRRSRRPPADPANALLSLGYTLLSQNLITACEVVGLDPYDGFYHADKYGRPALALDLMEEFRAVLVDSVVRRVINKGMLAPDDFSGPGGTLLSGRGLRRFLRAYTARVGATVYHPAAGRRLAYQQIFEVQARILARVIRGELDVYIPFRIR